MGRINNTYADPIDTCMGLHSFHGLKGGINDIVDRVACSQNNTHAECRY